MKKDGKNNVKPKKKDPMVENQEDSEITTPDSADENSIRDFIELKKLQNRVLGKLIDNINQTKNINNPKTKK
jgi:hypothetical protein